MRAGTLRHRIDIEEASEVQDDFGQKTKQWAATASRWAAIEPLQGKEAEYAKQISPEITTKVTLRYLSGVTAKHRVNFGGRILEVVSVLNTKELNEELILLCKEG